MKTKLYRTWYNIKTRCNNTNNTYYNRYGGRGIKVEWNSFEEFYRDMGETYKEGLQIDRIDNDGNYCKDNCRWATSKEQARNKGNNKIYKGKCLAEWAEELGINRTTIANRFYNLGWSIKDSIFTSININKRNKNALILN